MDDKQQKEIRLYNRILYLTRIGTVAALYAAITFLTRSMSFEPGQLRLADGLCVLPVLMPESLIGLVIGCFCANFMSPFHGLVWADVIFGTAATALGGWLGSKMRYDWLVPLPTVFVNAVVVSAIQTLSRQEPTFELLGINYLTMMVSGLLTCYLIGMPILLIKRHRDKKLKKTREKAPDKQ